MNIRCFQKFETQSYKYILEEMKYKHASEEQIEECKRKIKGRNHIFKRIIDSITLQDYKRK